MASITAFEQSQLPADYIKYWIAKIQLKMGNKKDAIETASEGLDIALKQLYIKYPSNKEVLAEAKE